MALRQQNPASPHRGNRAQMALVLVSGAYYSYNQISERTGRPYEQCKTRYNHLKRKGVWPISWDHLS